MSRREDKKRLTVPSGRDFVKDVILLQKGATTTPRSAAAFYEKGRVRNGVKFNTTFTEEQIFAEILQCFTSLSHFESPRLEIVKVVRNKVFAIHTKEDFQWSGVYLKKFTGQGNVYVRSLHHLDGPEGEVIPESDKQNEEMQGKTTEGNRDVFQLEDSETSDEFEDNTSVAEPYRPRFNLDQLLEMADDPPPQRGSLSSIGYVGSTASNVQLPDAVLPGLTYRYRIYKVETELIQRLIVRRL